MKRPWTAEESQAVMLYFSKDIERGIVPNKAKTEDCILTSERNCLKDRSWKDIKNYVYNKIRASK